MGADGSKPSSPPAALQNGRGNGSGVKNLNSPDITNNASVSPVPSASLTFSTSPSFDSSSFSNTHHHDNPSPSAADYMGPVTINNQNNNSSSPPPPPSSSSSSPSPSSLVNSILSCRLDPVPPALFPFLDTMGRARELENYFYHLKNHFESLYPVPNSNNNNNKNSLIPSSLPSPSRSSTSSSSSPSQKSSAASASSPGSSFTFPSSSSPPIPIPLTQRISHSLTSQTSAISRLDSEWSSIHQPFITQQEQINYQLHTLSSALSSFVSVSSEIAKCNLEMRKIFDIMGIMMDIVTVKEKQKEYKMKKSTNIHGVSNVYSYDGEWEKKMRKERYEWTWEGEEEEEQEEEDEEEEEDGEDDDKGEEEVKGMEKEIENPHQSIVDLKEEKNESSNSSPSPTLITRIISRDDGNEDLEKKM